MVEILVYDHGKTVAVVATDGNPDREIGRLAEGANFVVMDDSDLPQDRSERMLWVIKNGAVVVEAVTPPTQAELDAMIDDLTKDIDNGKSLIRALGVKVFKLEKKADPTLTPAKFKKSIRTIIAGF